MPRNIFRAIFFNYTRLIGCCRQRTFPSALRLKISLDGKRAMCSFDEGFNCGNQKKTPKKREKDVAVSAIFLIWFTAILQLSLHLLPCMHFDAIWIMSNWLYAATCVGSCSQRKSTDGVFYRDAHARLILRRWQDSLQGQFLVSTRREKRQDSYLFLLFVCFFSLLLFFFFCQLSRTCI